MAKIEGGKMYPSFVGRFKIEKRVKCVKVLIMIFGSGIPLSERK